MPILKLNNVGQYGINKDVLNHGLPLEAWTDGKNVRFIDGYATQYYGRFSIYETVQTTPLHIFPVTIGTDRHWIYLGATAAYSVYRNSSTVSIVHADLTPTGAISTTSPNEWTSCVLGGIPVINNGIEAPQRWDLGTANNFVDLDNWDATVTCKAIRVYKQFLIALDYTASGTRYPFGVLWSHPAEPGAVPASWDYSDPDYDAGRVDLAEGHDYIIDGLQLRDSFMIYKESSIWRMDLIGGPNVFSFKKVLGTSGAMNRNCIVELDGYHFVLTGSDVIIHDGQGPTTALDKQTRRFLFQDMDVDARDTAFVFKNPFFNEAYACYAQVGSSIPDKALVWNYRDRTVSFVDLPDIYHAAFGSDVNAVYTEAWDTDTGEWEDDISLWNSAEPVPRRAKVLLASADPAIYLLDAKAGDYGGAGNVYVERQGLFFNEDERRVLIQGIRPRIQGPQGTTVTIKVGGSDNSPYEAPVWDATMTHTIGQTVRNNCLVDRRYPAIRFENGTSQQWRLDSYDIEYEETSLW